MSTAETQTVPPFDRRSLRAALPPDALTPSTARSLAALARDLLALAALYALALALDSPLWWPAHALLAGTFFWALFVVGHDCGHGSFSRHAWLNRCVGHLAHAPLLVPFHPWRESHRLHHRHSGNLDREEAWAPLTDAQRAGMSRAARLLRFRLPLLVFPFYLLRGNPLRGGSHFDPRAPFLPASARARRRARTSVAACAVFAGTLAALAVVLGPLEVLLLYGGPYGIFAAWASVVTLLHHTDPDVPWYRGDGWTPLRGALATVDRRYGVLERIHHDAGCHLVHHLFPGIPHYRLRAATAALRPVLGAWHREAEVSVPRAFVRAVRDCARVPERGACVRAGPFRDRADDRVSARRTAPARAPRPGGRPA